jgi:hypothetical protein
VSVAKPLSAEARARLQGTERRSEELAKREGAKPEPGARPNTESLGNRMIDGIAVQGERITRVIPVGEIGNNAAINVVSETWYSPELKVVILGKRNDPRIGDLTYQLKNIKREPPPSSLFDVPPDYTVQTVRNEDEIRRQNENNKERERKQ